MAQFCTCGSLMISDHCTNKNCINKATTKATSAAKSAAAKARSELKAATKKVSTKRSSKCITYNLYDEAPKEEENT